jgi:hypothetical protein
MTRRSLLLTSTSVLIVSWVGVSPALGRGGRFGEPFDDGTFFDDGFGWCD